MGGGGGGGVHPLYPPTRSNPASLRRSPRVSPCLSILLLTATSIRRTPRLEGHPELVPAFLNSLKLTLYKMDISLSRTHGASTSKMSILEEELTVVIIYRYPATYHCVSEFKLS